MTHLGFQGPLLDLRNAFLDNEGDPIQAALRRLCEVLPEELQLPLELLVPTLDGQGLQALLVAGQVALEERGKHVEVGGSHRDARHRSEHGGRQEKCLGDAAGPRESTVFHQEPSPREKCPPDHGQSWVPRPVLPAHLLALGSLEVHIAVALPTSGRGTELPQPMGLGSLGQANIPEGPRGSCQLRGDPVDAYGKGNVRSGTA